MLEQLMVDSGRASRAAERRLTPAAEQQEMLTGLVVGVVELLSVRSTLATICAHPASV